MNTVIKTIYKKYLNSAANKVKLIQSNSIITLYQFYITRDLEFCSKLNFCIKKNDISLIDINYLNEL